jgi:hypothetical protein
MADGKEVGRGAPYNQSTGVPTITLFGVGPKGKHVYFMTSTSEAVTTMYIDGKPGPAGAPNLEAPVFSLDGERYAYLVISRPGAAQSATLIVDGKRGIPGGNPQFTADGKHVFSTNLVGGTVMEVYVDGKPFMRAPDVHLYMAPVGAGFLGVVNMPMQNNGRQNSFVTIANKKVPNSDCQQSVDRVYFSADGKHWAVRCRDAPTAYWAMADGKKGRDYYGMGEGIAFTADGRAVYQAQNNGKSFMVVGEEELGPYQSLMPEGKAVPGVNVTPDDPPATISGNRVGFIVMTQRGNERIVVVDGKPTKTLLASALKFSSDGSRFAYIAGNGARELFIDGVPNSGLGFPGNATLPNTYALSPDGKHVAQQSFSLSNVQKHGIAIDGKLILGEVGVGSLLTYTPDSKHLFWVSPRSGMARMHLFMDGQPIHEFGYTGGLLSTPDVWWSMGSDGVLTFLGQDGDAMKRYTVTP